MIDITYYEPDNEGKVKCLIFDHSVFTKIFKSRQQSREYKQTVRHQIMTGMSLMIPAHFGHGG